MGWNDIRSFNIRDRYADVELDDIVSVSDRARSLVARSKEAVVLQTAYSSVYGAVEMMSALDYHYSNFMTHFGQIGWDETIFNELEHEAVAYLNRMGQFYAFGRSRIVKSFVFNSLEMLPKLTELMVFRNKHTAHRVVDAPKPEDSSNLQEYYGGCIGLSFGRTWQPRPGCTKEWLKDWVTKRSGSFHPSELDKECAKRGFLAYQTEDEANSKALWFAPERDHDEVISQAYALMRVLVDAR